MFKLHPECSFVEISVAIASDKTTKIIAIALDDSLLKQIVEALP
ncbi:MAG: hypothetical protein AB1861_06225 [Cyanobacteriota bacterium]